MITDNLGYDVNRAGTNLFIIQLAFLSVAWTISFFRAYVKLCMIRKVTADDYWMLASLLVYSGYGAIVFHGIIVGGFGKHTTQLTADGAEISLRAWYLCEVLYPPMSAFIRTSIAVFLLRLAVKRWQKWIIYIVIAITWLASMGLVVITVIQCLPPSYFWGQIKGTAEGSCINPAVVPNAAIAHGSASAACDWILGLFPIVLLWNVQINRRTKISIAVLLGMGMIAGAAMIIRLLFIKTLVISVDFLYETVLVAIWSVLEPGLGIMAGSIATLRPLVKSLGFGLSTSRKYDSDKPTGESRGWSLRRSRQNMEEVIDSHSKRHAAKPASKSMEIKLIDATASAGQGVNYAQCCPWDVEAGQPQRPSRTLARP